VSRLVVVLAGPTGAGKTHWALHQGLAVWDWDAAGRNPARYDEGLAVIAANPDALVAVERQAPLIEQRVLLALKCEATHVYVLDPGEDIVHERIEARGRPAAAHEHDAAQLWYSRYVPHPQHPQPPSHLEQ
jgi:hypothetical protein